MGRGRQKSVEYDSHSQAGSPDIHQLIFQSISIEYNSQPSSKYSISLWLIKLVRLFFAEAQNGC